MVLVVVMMAIVIFIVLGLVFLSCFCFLIHFLPFVFLSFLVLFFFDLPSGVGGRVA